MPQMGVSVSEGTITKWLKQEGEHIEADESLLEISTDKVDTEVPSPASGTVTQILVQEGETVEVGTKLAVIGGEAAGAPAPAAEAPPEPATAQAAAEAEAPSSAETPAPQPAPAPAARSARSGADTRRRSADERRAGREELRLARRRAHRLRARDRPRQRARHRARRPRDEEGHPQLRRVGCRSGGSGKRLLRRSRLPPRLRPRSLLRPRLLLRSLLRPQHACSGRSSRSAARSRRHARRPHLRPRAAPAPAMAAAGEQLEPMTAMRRGIADHMRRSLDTSAHVTSAIEVDMSRVVAIRDKLKPEFQKQYGVNPTYLIFVARAVVETLKHYPWINGEIRGEQIVTRPWINLGFAVELADGKGLIVPVVKHAEGLNLLGMAQAVTDIADRARNKKLTPDEVQGGTFTITNPGGYGTFHGTPVISQPQAGILGTYALVKRPWVVQDSFGKDVIAIRPIMNITLTYDHRLVDGALAGRFLKDLREALETWEEISY